MDASLHHRVLPFPSPLRRTLRYPQIQLLYPLAVTVQDTILSLWCRFVADREQKLQVQESSRL